MPARSRSVSTARRPAFSNNPSTALDCPWPTSTASIPPRTSASAAAGTRSRITSRPSGPPSNASRGSYSVISGASPDHSCLPHVGWVRDDQVVGPAHDQVGDHELHVECVALRVLARHVDRVRRVVDARDPHALALLRDGERNRAAAGTDIQHALTVLGQVHEQLRLGSRHEHAMVDDQLELAEVRAPEDVGDRLASHAAAHHVIEAERLVHVEPAAGVGVQCRAVHAERCGQQHLGVELRCVRARRLEGLGCLGQRVAQR